MLETYDTVKTVVSHEFYGEPVDTEATARKVWQHMKTRGDLDTLKSEKRLWARTELAHLITLDYFSSYEPTHKKG